MRGDKEDVEHRGVGCLYVGGFIRHISKERLRGWCWVD